MENILLQGADKKMVKIIGELIGITFYFLKFAEWGLMHILKRSLVKLPTKEY